MNIKTNLPEEYVEFVDTTKKQNIFFNKFIFLIAVIMFSFLIYLLFKYLNEKQFLFTKNI